MELYGKITMVVKGFDTVLFRRLIRLLFSDFTQIYRQIIDSVDIHITSRKKGEAMSEMSMLIKALVEIKYYSEVLISIWEKLTEMFSEIDDGEVKPESKMIKNTDKKTKVKAVTFAEVRTIVADKLSGVDSAWYVSFLVETVVYSVIRDATRRAVEIIIELLIYETSKQVAIFTVYSLIWICIFWKQRYIVLSICKRTLYGVKKFVKKTKDRHKRLFKEEKKQE